MSNMHSAREKELSFNEKLNIFMNKHRKKLLFAFSAVIVCLLAFIVTLVVRERMQANSIRQLNTFETRFQEIRPFLDIDVFGAEDRQAEIDVFLKEIEAFAAGTFGFAAARSYNIAAEIHWERSNWAAAEKAWLAAARAARRSYLAPISVFNAAAAAEEQGNIEAAIELYTRALAYGDIFLGAPRAQFAIGRLHEYLNDYNAALLAYRSLVSRWPNDPIWSNLAQSRIMLLSD